MKIMNSYTCLFDVFKNKHFLKVNAKNPEKAAKKMYRANKKGFSEIGYVHLVNNDDENDEWMFDISKWTVRGSNKMISKPKK